MPKKLTKVEISQIDFVDNGASVDKSTGEGAHILLAKRVGKSMYAMEGGDQPPMATTFNEEMAEAEQRELAYEIHSEIMEKVCALIESITNTVFDPAVDREALITESLGQFSAAMLESVPAWLAGEVEKGGMEPEAAAKINRILQSISGLQAGKVENTMAEDTKKTATPGAEGAAAPVAAPVDDSIAKRMADLEAVNKAQAEEIQKNKERAEAAETLAKQERDARIMRDVKDDLAKNFAAMPNLDAEKDAPLFKKIQEGEALAKEDVSRLREILTAANEAIKAGELFKEVGGNGPAVGATAMAKAEAKADELVKSGLFKNRTAALAKVWESNPELYAEFEAERKAAVRVQ